MKPVMSGSDRVSIKAMRDTLWLCMDTGLKLLHPIMPFITEDLWQRLPRLKKDKMSSIMVEQYPIYEDSRNDNEIEIYMELSQEIIKSVRSNRFVHKVSPKQKLELYIVTSSDLSTRAVNTFSDDIGTLTNCICITECIILPTDCSVLMINEAVTVHLRLPEISNVIEIQKLNTKATSLKSRITEMTKHNVTGYNINTPIKIVKENEIKLSKLNVEYQLIEDALIMIKKQEKIYYL
jgi:valyl-tRNA synthetase